MMNGPAYAQIYNVLKREIIEGEFVIGSLLPPEPELEKRFHVSRTTVRRAVDLLSREGFVKAQQGFGTQILDYKTKQNLNAITSMSETLRQKGHEVSPKSMYIDIVAPSPHIAKDLGIAEDEKVARVQRIQLVDGHPIAIMKNYIPASLAPGIENHVSEIKSLYQFLENRYNISIENAHDRISARNADFSEAQMLEVEVGAALLYMRRVCYAGGRPVCADRISIVGEKYELDINMTGRKSSAGYE